MASIPVNITTKEFGDSPKGTPLTTQEMDDNFLNLKERAEQVNIKVYNQEDIPVSPVDGDIWYVSSEKKYFVYDEAQTVWIEK